MALVVVGAAVITPAPFCPLAVPAQNGVGDTDSDVAGCPEQCQQRILECVLQHRYAQQILEYHERDNERDKRSTTPFICDTGKQHYQFNEDKTPKPEGASDEEALEEFHVRFLFYENSALCVMAKYLVMLFVSIVSVAGDIVSAGRTVFLWLTSICLLYYVPYATSTGDSWWGSVREN